MMNGGDLPSDLIIDILSRLSVKSLIRFKCVCKSWRSLFENSIFITKHLNSNNERDDSILLRYYTFDPHRFSYSFLSYETLDMIEEVDLREHIEFERGSRYLDIVACCNGIVCFQLGDYVPRYLCLWNPATRQFRKLMNDPRNKCDYACMSSSGFGYDAKGNDYKVIQLPSDDSTCAYHPHIYELSSNSWRICDAIAPVASYSRENAAKMYTNGIFSWLVTDRNPNNGFIVSFDMSKEVFITTELPDKTKGIRYNQSLAALNKSLVLFRLTCDCNDFQGEILKLNDYGVKESWTKLYTIVSSVRRFFVFPMSFWKNGDILATTGGKLFVLNPKTQETTCFPQLDPLVSSIVPFPCLWVYKESLVPVI